MIDPLRLLPLLITGAAVLCAPSWAQATADAPAVPSPTSEAAQALSAADAALASGNDVTARQAYEAVVSKFPGSPEATLAQRSLHAMGDRGAPSPPAPDLAPPPPPPSTAALAPTEAPQSADGIVFSREPYSLRTKERIRISTWEKVDFVSTAFTYGASVGFSYALALKASGTGDILGPTIVGATLYTLGAVGYLVAAHPDRGDLPLVLAIGSYLPTTVAFALSWLAPTLDGQTAGIVVALAGTAALPLALVAANYLDLDPGDMQLIRDAGFWGMVLGLAGAAGFGQGSSSGALPAWQSISAAGLVGLYLGLGCGGLAVALKSDVSLERVRVTTWGGYGGAILGSLVTLAVTANQPNSGQATFAGGAVGAALGLGITFAATSAIDIVPADAQLARLTPVISPLTSGGGSGVSFGVHSSF